VRCHSGREGHSTKIRFFPNGKEVEREHSEFQKERVCGWMDGWGCWLLDDPSSDESNDGINGGEDGREKKVGGGTLCCDNW